MDFIKNVIRQFLTKPEPVKLNYPVFIGYNGYDIIPQNVENSFKELTNYFEVLYFDYYNNTLPNRIIYRFKVRNPKIDTSYTSFIELLQKITEKVLVQHLRKFEVHLPCDNFIAVHIDGDILYISIAKNDLGIAETIEVRRKIKADYFDSQNNEKRKEILTNWNEGKR